MRSRKSRNLHLVGKDEGKQESPEKLIRGCPHISKLVDDIVKNRISEEEAQQERARLGRHPVSGEDVSILLCTECYKKGDIVYWEDRKGRYRLRWPVELDVFKAKHGR